MTEEKKLYFISPKWGTVNGETAVTPKGRITYVNVEKPNTNFKEPIYGVTLLWKKDEVNKQEFAPMIEKCKLILAQIFPNGNVPAFSFPPIKDGDNVKPGKTVGEHPGCYFINASSPKPLLCKEQVGGKIVDCDKTKFVGGVMCRAVVQAKLFKQNGVFVGFSWGLQLLQFISDDGTRFFAGPDPTELLDVLAEEPQAPTASDSFDAALTAPVAAPVAAKGGIMAGIDIL